MRLLYDRTYTRVSNDQLINQAADQPSPVYYLITYDDLPKQCYQLMIDHLRDHVEYENEEADHVDLQVLKEIIKKAADVMNWLTPEQGILITQTRWGDDRDKPSEDSEIAFVVNPSFANENAQTVMMIAAEDYFRKTRVVEVDSGTQKTMVFILPLQYDSSKKSTVNIVSSDQVYFPTTPVI